ncbi:MAG: 4-vinyl reductase [Geobacteraceae bacterium]|nr:4-vinyl reductase [Geobacteraceae bacterium]
MIKSERTDYRFKWSNLGDIAAGRPHLGDSTHVAVYRLMQYTMREVLATRYGPDTASDILREAGKLAGTEFCKNTLNANLDFNGFIADLQDQLRTLNVGILRIEKADLGSLELVMTVAEDLDCSGLPVFDETVCEYDEGFLAGVLEVYTGREFYVKETDCWASGARTCRFRAKPVGKEVP